MTAAAYCVTDRAALGGLGVLFYLAEYHNFVKWIHDGFSSMRQSTGARLRRIPLSPDGNKTNRAPGGYESQSGRQVEWHHKHELIGNGEIGRGIDY